MKVVFCSLHLKQPGPRTRKMNSHSCSPGLELQHQDLVEAFLDRSKEWDHEQKAEKKRKAKEAKKTRPKKPSKKKKKKTSNQEEDQDQRTGDGQKAEAESEDERKGEGLERTNQGTERGHQKGQAEREVETEVLGQEREEEGNTGPVQLASGIPWCNGKGLSDTEGWMEKRVGAAECRSCRLSW